MPPPNTRTGPKCAVPDGEREGGCGKAGRGVRRSRRLAIRIGFHKVKLEKPTPNFPSPTMPEQNLTACICPASPLHRRLHALPHLLPPTPWQRGAPLRGILSCEHRLSRQGQVDHGNENVHMKPRGKVDVAPRPAACAIPDAWRSASASTELHSRSQPPNHSFPFPPPRSTRPALPSPSTPHARLGGPWSTARNEGGWTGRGREQGTCLGENTLESLRNGNLSEGTS